MFLVVNDICTLQGEGYGFLVVNDLYTLQGHDGMCLMVNDMSYVPYRGRTLAAFC